MCAGDIDALSAAGVVIEGGAISTGTYSLRDIAPAEELTEDYGSYQTLPWYEELCSASGVESTNDDCKVVLLAVIAGCFEVAINSFIHTLLRTHML